jgi:RNA polymerase sigma-70 factor, ECF subfamily
MTLPEATLAMGEASTAWSTEGVGRRMTTDATVAGDRELVAMAPTLLAAARYLVRSEADAADLVQATLEIAVRQRHQLRDPARLRAWLLTIETREAFRLRRRLRSLVTLDGRVLEAPVAGPSVDDLAVRLAIAKLPGRMRAAVVLHHLVSLSVAETAEAMGVTQNTVKTLLRHAFAQLREVLA